MQDQPPRPNAELPPRWQPVSAIDRRVLGVLVEKAKTTPDVYPMTISALRSGCNQKNNRDPLLMLEPDDIEASLDRLRALGAVAEVQGGGRVAKFRHYLYEWMGVDKVELAVMTELLLRGAQTAGELRGRAARMEPIADISALRPILEQLKAKGLVLSLTPDGRGHVVTHALHSHKELDKQRQQFAEGATAHSLAGEDPVESISPVAATHSPPASMRPAAAATTSSNHEIAELREQIRGMRDDFQQLLEQVDQLSSELERLKQALGA